MRTSLRLSQPDGSPRLSINQDAEYIHGCFGLSDEQARRVKDMLASWAETCKCPGELLAHVWEHRHLSLQEKAFATYAVATWTEELEHVAAVGAALSKMLGA